MYTDMVSMYEISVFVLVNDLEKCAQILNADS